MRPVVGRSIPVRILSRVDLPLPDGPLIAKRLPVGMENEIESRITVLAALFVITLETFSTRTSVPVCNCGGVSLAVIMIAPFKETGQGFLVTSLTMCCSSIMAQRTLLLSNA